MKWPRILPSAYEDALVAIERISLTNPRGALEFPGVLANALEEIEAHPRQFARLETNRTEQEIRRVVLRRFNYLVIFKMVRDTPVVVAVMHASQQPDSWLR